AQARRRHPQLTFIQGDALDFALDEKFDYIILSDLVNELWDVQRVLERLMPACTPDTRIVLNFYSHLWESPRAAAGTMRVANPLLQQNWMTPHDVRNLLYLTGFEVTRLWQEILWPIRTPG